MRRLYVLSLALLLPAAASAAPPPLFSPNIPAYLTALRQSTDPEAKAIRARIASGPADLAQERTLAEKEGIATRPGQLAQTLPPADQNAAVLYARLNALRQQKPFSYLLSPGGPSAEFVSLRNAPTPAQAAALESVVARRPDIFPLLHTAIARPQCVFPEPSSPLDFPKEYTGMRESARELRAESTVLAFRGKYADAAANQELGFRLAAHVLSTPKLIGFYVGSAIDAITVSSLQDIIAKAGPDAVLDGKVSADLLALPPLPLSHSLSGEPAVVNAEFTIFHHAAPAELADALQFSGRQTMPPAAAFTPAEQTELGRLLDAAEADYIHQMRQIIPAADNPHTRHAVFAAAETRAQANTEDPIQAISDYLNPVVYTTRIMGSTPTLGGLEQQAARVAARRLVAAAGASVLAAKAQTGAFPVSLPASFIDPFTSKPLGYHLEGTSGFVVYSAGPTGTFGGGKPGETVPAQESVFRYPAVPVGPTPLVPRDPPETGR